MKNTLTVSFIVREDLPFERSNAYRDLIIRGIESLKCELNTTLDDHEMIDRLLNDHNEGHVLVAVEQRRAINQEIRKATEAEEQDHTLIKQLENVVDSLSKVIGD